jgi:hypothetical protein
MNEFGLRITKNHMLIGLGLVALVVLTVFLTHLASGERGVPTVPGDETASAPYQVALPYQAPEITLMPGQVLVPVQVLSAGEIVVPSRGVVYVSGNQPGKVYSQTYTDLSVARVSGYAHPVRSSRHEHRRGAASGARAPAGAASGIGSTLSRGEKGAIIGGVIGAGTGVLVDKKHRGRGAG